MPLIKLAGFSGEQPRIVPRLLPPPGATRALNVRLDDGALTPFHRPTLLAQLEDGPYDTIYRAGETWLAFAGTVNLAPGPVAQDRLYYTGDGAPKMRVENTVYPLAVPRPAAAPTATPDGSGSGDVQSRSYVYTFVTSFGEESEPSPASDPVDWQPGQTVVLSNIAEPPEEPARGVTLQRFYRSQSGSAGTDFYFIAERAVSDADFEDDVAPDAFAEPLPSRFWNAPPDTLAGLIALPNGMMAAFSGRRLYFCEPYRPHAWPEIYVLTTDVPIVALAAAGTSVWVLTERNPYRVVGTAPDAMVMDKVEANLPCSSARGVVDLGHAVAWPSHEGLAVARSDGAVGLATGNLFSPRDWRALNPQAMRASQISGRWIGSYSGVDAQNAPIAGSLIIDIGAQSFLIRTEIQARSWFYEEASGLLHYLDLDGRRIWLFDSPDGGPLALYWRSKEFVLPRPDTFGCILIETGAGFTADEIAGRLAEIAAIAAANAAAIAAGPIGGDLGGAAIGVVTLGGDLLTPLPSPTGSIASVGLYADGELVATISDTNRVARLPAGFLGRVWEVDVFSEIQIDQITVARTARELQQAGGGP